MADQKLSQLTELATTPADDDEIYIRDVSEVAALESKRITIANLKTAVICDCSSLVQLFSSPEEMANSPVFDTPTKAWT